MSRTRHAARSLASGYVALVVNALYTLASVPLALHYLGEKQFGLWATVTTVGANLTLLDLGMTAAVTRFLLDYKDDRSSPGYRSVVQTGALVLALQGAAIAVCGCLLSLVLPRLLNIEAAYARDFRNLVAGQCVLTGIFFSTRILTSLLQAHQRFDMPNFAQMIQLVIIFAVQWITFHLGYGVYSLLVAAGAGLATGAIINFSSVLWLQLGPSARNIGRASWQLFREMFAFGNDLFLMSLGLQLLNQSQALIITATLGLEAAGLWAVATKAFQLAFQFIQKIYDFSGSAFGEMIVRQEGATLKTRFRDVITITAAVAAFACASVAVANAPFVTLLSHGKFSWHWWDDALMGVLIFCTSVTRCFVGLSGYAKQVEKMRWVYFLEGICFVVTAFVAVQYFGLAGLISVAIFSNLAWSGSYGFRWAARYFQVRARDIVAWFLPPLRYLLLMLAYGVALWRLTSHLPAKLRFAIDTAGMLAAGLPLLWFVGFNQELRAELRIAFRRLTAGGRKA
jgi:O-antigen/teichoic acid export membrane protein